MSSKCFFTVCPPILSNSNHSIWRRQGYHFSSYKSCVYTCRRLWPNTNDNDTIGGPKRAAQQSSTRSGCIQALQPYDFITQEWVAEKFPKHAAPKSDGRQAVSNGRIRSFRINRQENGDLTVGCYVVAKISDKYYWNTVTLHKEGQEIEQECACNARGNCSHKASILYAIVLVRVHSEDAAMPDWIKPVGLKKFSQRNLDQIGIESRWPKKFNDLFSVLDQSHPARGGPQHNNKK